MHAQPIVTCGIIGGALAGLALCSGCDGKGAEDCALDSGILDVSIVLAEDYPASLTDNFDDRMRLGVIHTDEEPDPSRNCTQIAHETVVVQTHSLDLNQAFQVPSGWICAHTSGRYTTLEGEGVTIVCYGSLPSFEVPGCDRVEAPIVVECEAEPYEGH